MALVDLLAILQYVQSIVVLSSLVRTDDTALCCLDRAARAGSPAYKTINQELPLLR